MDNWTLYLYYLDTVFHLVNDEETDSSVIDGEEMPDTTIESCVDFLGQLQKENYNLMHQLRGPYLAALELYLKLSFQGKNAEKYVGKRKVFVTCF